MWRQPIIDRTLSDVEYAKNFSSEEDLKGTLNVSDWIRITENIYYLSELLTKYGYKVKVKCKIDWSKDYIPRVSDVEQIKTDINSLKSAYIILSTTPQTPNLPYTLYTKINDIEKILLDINNLLKSEIEGLKRLSFRLGGGKF